MSTRPIVTGALVLSCAVLGSGCAVYAGAAQGPGGSGPSAPVVSEPGRGEAPLAGAVGHAAIPQPEADGGGVAPVVRVAPVGTPSPVLPAQFVAGYLEAYNLGLPSSLPNEYDVLYHAFAPIDSNGAVSIYTSNGIDRRTLAAEYHARRAAGKPTILSIGGEGGAKAGLGTPAQQQRFLDSVIPLIDEFGFAGIDWDLELAVPGGISIDGVVAVSRTLRATYPGFLITMAPFGASEIEGTYQEIARQLQSTGDLTYVGFQFYNDVEAPTTAHVLRRLEGWIQATGIRPDQFVIGLWQGPDAWLGHVTTPTRMVEIWEGVTAVYPTVRGVYTWGIRTTDLPLGFPFATQLGAVVGG